MIEVLDIIVGSYEYVLAIVNFICSVSFFLLSAYIAVSWTLGIVKSRYKKAAIAAFLSLISLCIVHYLSIVLLGITIFLLPLQNAYFIAFMQVIQYIVTFALASLCVAILFFSGSSQIDENSFYKRMSACLACLVLALMHHWIAIELGVPLILPPLIW